MGEGVENKGIELEEDFGPKSSSSSGNDGFESYKIMKKEKFLEDYLYKSQYENQKSIRFWLLIYKLKVLFFLIFILKLYSNNNLCVYVYVLNTSLFVNINFKKINNWISNFCFKQLIY